MASRGSSRPRSLNDASAGPLPTEPATDAGAENADESPDRLDFALTFDSITEAIAPVVERLEPVMGGAFFAHLADVAQFELRHLTGRSKHAVQELRLPATATSSLVGTVARTLQPLYAGNAEVDPAWRSISARSVYLLPVLWQQALLGIVGVFTRDSDGVCQECRNLLQALIETQPARVAKMRELEMQVRRFARTLQSIDLALQESGAAVGGRHVLPNAALQELKTLTPREWEVMRRLLDGYRVGVIARHLHLSEHTVRNHLKSIFRKTGVNSQAQLLEYLIGDRSWDR